MDTLGMIVFTVVGVGFVLWPLLTETDRSQATSQEDTPLGRLALQKELLLTNLSDLDFEFSMGKLSEDDYQRLRTSLKRQAGHVIEKIDTLTGGAEVATASKVPPPGRFCVHCGTSLPADARFCSQCGKEVAA